MQGHTCIFLTLPPSAVHTPPGSPCLSLSHPWAGQEVTALTEGTLPTPALGDDQGSLCSEQSLPISIVFAKYAHWKRLVLP